MSILRTINENFEGAKGPVLAGKTRVWGKTENITIRSAYRRSPIKTHFSMGLVLKCAEPREYCYGDSLQGRMRGSQFIEAVSWQQWHRSVIQRVSPRILQAHLPILSSKISDIHYESAARNYSSGSGTASRFRAGIVVRWRAPRRRGVY